jgi:hypothetical protein
MWRFRLSEDTILEVSAPKGATEKQVRRRGRVSLVLMTLIAGAILVGAASAAVWTDKFDYAYGETVQIAGDAMTAGEDVSVDVSFPDGSLAQHHVVQADENGNFSDSFDLVEGMPSGIYTVTATGQTSGNEYTTEFDPAGTFSVTLSGDNSAFTGPLNAKTYTASPKYTQSCGGTVTAVSYTWTNPGGGATFSNASSATPSVTFTATGNVTLRVDAQITGGSCGNTTAYETKDVSVTAASTLSQTLDASTIYYGQSTNIYGWLRDADAIGIPGKTVSVDL